MKIALLADIHGNDHALEAVLADIADQSADRIVVLGDLVFKGPRPEECVKAIQRLHAQVIRGNIDELVGLGRIQEGFAKSESHAQALLTEMEWTRGRLSKSELAYLAELPFSLEMELMDGHMLHCVHATPQNVLDIVPMDAKAQQLERMFVNERASIVAYAHIHYPYVKFWNGKTIVNTGSVGLPFDGDPRASYALIETLGDKSSITIRRVKYDIEAAVKAYHKSGHPYADSVIAALKAGRPPM
ncbi:MAG TPA: metallophosphoesterase family protein [Bacilli bacterium]